MSLDSISGGGNISRVLDYTAPWQAGIFELQNHSDTYKFLRVGYILSSYVIIVAGYLEFNKSYDQYIVVAGLTQARDYHWEILNNQDAEPETVAYIKYEEKFGGSNGFGVALFYLNTPFHLTIKTRSAVGSNIYNNPGSGGIPGNGRYIPGRVYLSYTKYETTVMNGFTRESLEKNYLATGMKNFSDFYLGNVTDCLITGNFISTTVEMKNKMNFGMFGIQTESGVVFDEDFCADKHNMLNVVGIRPNIIIANLINEALSSSCPPSKFTCGEQCLSLELLCNKNKDCVNGQDEEEIYCKYREKFSNFGKVQVEKINSNSTLIIVIVVSGLIIISIFMIFLGITIQRKKLSQAITNEKIEEFFNGIPISESDPNAKEHKENCEHIPYQKDIYEINSNQIKLDENGFLGSGEFGEVHRGKLTLQNYSEIEVAVKSTKKNSNALNSLLMEIKICIHLGGHPNLIGFFGATTKNIRSGVVSLIIEFCSLGNLLDFIKKHKKIPEDGANYTNIIDQSGDFNLEDMKRWSYEISCAMEHLGNKKVIHGDLAARNVLLTSTKIAKITDFGLSRKLYTYTQQYHKMTSTPLPFRWMAFESLKFLEFTLKSDIWSYGITVWEIFSLGDIPYKGGNWSTEFVDELENGLRLQKPKHASIKLFELLLSCWNLEPSTRPSFTDIKAFINSSLNEI